VEKTLFNRLASHSNSISSIILLTILSSNSIAENLQNQIDNIVLTDETKNSLMKQDKIVGCDDSLKINELKCSKERTPEDRDKDIDEIKSQLSEILKQLAELKKEKDVQTKDSKLSTIKKSIKQLTIKADNNITKSYTKPKEIKVVEKKANYVVVEVQSGESLSKYAQKYYGDGRKYQNIYRANRDKISKNLQIYIGDRLIVPTSSSYKYKEFNKTKKIKKVEIINIEPIVVEESNKTTIPNFVQPKKIEKSNNSVVNKLDKAIYVGDEDKQENNNSGFIPLQENLPWVETRVPKGVDIYQLAQTYYGDKKEYYRIYNANKNILNKDLKIKEGEVLKIPITDKFEEKPEYLGIK